MRDVRTSKLNNLWIKHILLFYWNNLRIASFVRRSRFSMITNCVQIEQEKKLTNQSTWIRIRNGWVREQRGAEKRMVFGMAMMCGAYLCRAHHTFHVSDSRQCSGSSSISFLLWFQYHVPASNAYLTLSVSLFLSTLTWTVQAYSRVFANALMRPKCAQTQTQKFQWLKWYDYVRRWFGIVSTFRRKCHRLMLYVETKTDNNEKTRRNEHEFLRKLPIIRCIVPFDCRGWTPESHPD